VKRLLQKKLWWMLTCIANRQSSINNKTKLNEAIPNIDEHNEANPVFSRIYLVPHASSVLFDGGEVHCRIYDLWLSRIYKQTIAWKWARPLKILQYWYLYLDPYAKQIKAHLTLLRMPHVTKWENWQKNWQIESDWPNSPNFFTAKNFYRTVIGFKIMTCTLKVYLQK